MAAMMKDAFRMILSPERRGQPGPLYYPCKAARPQIRKRDHVTPAH
jgi:hypothetical protein